MELFAAVGARPVFDAATAGELVGQIEARLEQVEALCSDIAERHPCHAGYGATLPG